MGQSRKEEVLQKYHSFGSVIAHIKPIILGRTAKDQLHTVHYQADIYRITLKRYLLHKQLGVGKVLRRVEAKNGSAASTDSDRRPSPVRSYPKKAAIMKQVSPCKSNDTVSMRRLTRNLSKMVRGLEDNFYMHPSQIFEVMEMAPSHVLD